MKDPTAHDRTATSRLPRRSASPSRSSRPQRCRCSRRPPVRLGRQRRTARRQGQAEQKCFPFRTTLTDDKVGHWAVVLRNITAHRLPRASSPVVTTLGTVTSEDTQNLVLILRSIDIDARQHLVQGQAADPPEQLDRLGSTERARQPLRRAHPSLRRPQDVHRQPEARRSNHLHHVESASAARTGPHRAGSSTSATSSPASTAPVYGPLAFGTSARSARPHRLARRRLHRHPRHERARDPARCRLTRCIRMSNDAITSSRG